MNYKKIRGYIGIFIFICCAIYPKVDRLDNYDMQTQNYILFTFIVLLLIGMYLTAEYLIDWKKNNKID